MKILDKTNKDTVILLDEYQFMKQGYEKGNFDSFVEIALDKLSERITIILCGSYISVMRELSTYTSPLYGRFSFSLEIQPFNYYEASAFYPKLSPRDKEAFYAVFEGLPFVLEKLIPEKGLAWNIKALLLDKSSAVCLYSAHRDSSQGDLQNQQGTGNPLYNREWEEEKQRDSISSQCNELCRS